MFCPGEFHGLYRISMGSQRVTRLSKFHFHFLCGGLGGKESAFIAGDPCSIPGSGRSPGEGNGYPLQYFYHVNSMDRRTWRAIVHGVAMSLTGLSEKYGLFTLSPHLPTLVKATSMQTLRRWSLGRLVHHLLSQLAFI